MKDLKILSLVLFSGLFMQCKTVKNATTASDLSHAIKGVWKIDYVSCCGRVTDTIFDGNQTIHFDTRHSLYAIYQGEEKVKSGVFHLQAKKMGTMILLDQQYPAILRITDKKLYIDWSYMDLKREVYKR